MDDELGEVVPTPTWAVEIREVSNIKIIDNGKKNLFITTYKLFPAKSQKIVQCSILYNERKV
jgi:hypothetical protein